MPDAECLDQQQPNHQSLTQQNQADLQRESKADWENLSLREWVTERISVCENEWLRESQSARMSDWENLSLGWNKKQLLSGMSSVTQSDMLAGIAGPG